MKRSSIRSITILGLIGIDDAVLANGFAVPKYYEALIFSLVIIRSRCRPDRRSFRDDALFIFKILTRPRLGPQGLDGSY